MHLITHCSRIKYVLFKTTEKSPFATVQYGRIAMGDSQERYETILEKRQLLLIHRITNERQRSI